MITGDHEHLGTFDQTANYNDKDEQVLISAFENKKLTIVILRVDV